MSTRSAAFLAVVAGVASFFPNPALAKVLHVVPVAMKGLSEYRVTCDACGKDKFCLNVRSFLNKRQTDSITIESGSPCSEIGLSEDDRAESGSEDSDARKFRLTPNSDAVLIDESSYGEVMEVHYWLVGSVDGKLKELWKDRFGNNEVAWGKGYAVKVSDQNKNGRDEIDRVNAFVISNNSAEVERMLADTEHEAAVDSWDRQYLEFDETAKGLKALPFKEFAAIIFSGKSSTEAMKYRDKLGRTLGCKLEDLLVLDSEKFPKLGKGLYVVAAFLGSEEEAKSRLESLKACSSEISGYTKQVL